MAQRRLEITDQIDTWLDQLNAPPDAVAAILAEHADHPRAQMMTHPDVGRLLSLLVHATGGRRVLEIGTFVGVSAVWMAEALGSDGTLDTLEIDDATADIAEHNIARAGLADRVRVHRGPALDTLAHLDAGAYDVAYIDADKPAYPAYLDACLRLVRPGGMIVADNLLLGGRAADPTSTDEAVLAMRDTARRATSDPRLMSVALSIGDGVLVAVVKG